MKVVERPVTVRVFNLKGERLGDAIHYLVSNTGDQPKFYWGGSYQPIYFRNGEFELRLDY